MLPIVGYARPQSLILTTQPEKNPSGISDNEKLAELLAKCEQGSESAFEELYTSCSGQLYGVLVRILTIEAVAEEALQDTFVKVWQKSGLYVPESGPPMAWMSSIARHQALDLLRRRGSRENYERTDTDSYIDSAADLTKPFHEMTADATLLIQCLEKLPEGARECIVRAYCEGYSHEELSQRTDTPVGTIKSWIRRGLLSLRKCIDEYA